MYMIVVKCCEKTHPVMEGSCCRTDIMDLFLGVRIYYILPVQSDVKRDVTWVKISHFEFNGFFTSATYYSLAFRPRLKAEKYTVMIYY